MAIQNSFVAKIQVILQGADDAATKLKKIQKLVDTQAKVITKTGKAQKLASKNVLGYGRSLDEAIVRVGKYALALRLLQAVFGTLSQTFRDVIKLQTELIQLEKVLPVTTDFIKFTGQAVKIAEELGAELGNVSKAFFLFGQQGLSASQVLERTRVAIMGVNAANLTVEQSVNAITAALNIFNDEGLTATSVIDKLVAVQAGYAVTTEDLFYGLQRAGPIVKSMGDSFDFLLGITAAVAQATRKSGAEVGSAYKRLLSTITRPDTEAVLNKVGVAVRKNATEFRTLQEIMTDLHSTWAKLSDVEQSNIAQTVAGVRRRDVFLALLESFPVAIDAMATSMVSLGRAEMAQEAQLKTFEARMNSLKAAAVGLGQKFDPQLKEAISGLESFVRVLISGFEKLGSVGTTLTLGMSFIIVALLGIRGAVVGVVQNVLGLTGTMMGLNAQYEGLAVDVAEATAALTWFQRRMLAVNAVTLDAEKGIMGVSFAMGTLGKGIQVFFGTVTALGLILPLFFIVMSLFKSIQAGADDAAKRVQSLSERLLGLKFSMREVINEAGKIQLTPEIISFDPNKIITPTVLRKTRKLGEQVAAGLLDPKKFKKYGNEIVVILENLGREYRRSLGPEAEKTLKDIKKFYKDANIPAIKHAEVITIILAAYEALDRQIGGLTDEIISSFDEMGAEVAKKLGESGATWGAIFESDIGKRLRFELNKSFGLMIFDSEEFRNRFIDAMRSASTYNPFKETAFQKSMMDLLNLAPDLLEDIQNILTGRGIVSRTPQEFGRIAQALWDVATNMDKTGKESKNIKILAAQFAALAGTLDQIPNAASLLDDTINQAFSDMKISSKDAETFLDTFTISLSEQISALDIIKRKMEELLKTPQEELKGKTFGELLFEALTPEEMDVLTQSFSDFNLELIINRKDLQDQIDRLNETSSVAEKLKARLNELTGGYITDTDAVKKLTIELARLKKETKLILDTKQLEIWGNIATEIDKFTHSLTTQEKFLIKNADFVTKIFTQTTKLEAANKKIVGQLKEQGITNIKSLSDINKTIRSRKKLTDEDRARLEINERIINALRAAGVEDVEQLKTLRELNKLAEATGKAKRGEVPDAILVAQKEEELLYRLKEEFKLRQKMFELQQLQPLLISQFIDIEEAIGQAVEDSVDTLFKALEDTGKPLRALSAAFAEFAHSLADSIIDEISRMTAVNITTEFLGIGLAQSISNVFANDRKLRDDAEKRNINIYDLNFKNRTTDFINKLHNEHDRFLKNYAELLGIDKPSGLGNGKLGEPGNIKSEEFGVRGLQVPGFDQIKNEIRDVNVTLENSENWLKTISKWTEKGVIETAKAFVELGHDLAPLGSIFFGTAIGGGGIGARTGATYGSLLGKTAGDRIGKSIGGTLGSIFGPLGSFGFGALGGFLGGLLDSGDKQDEQIEAVDLNTDMLKRNTEAIENNNRLIALQNQLINVPAGFTIPSFGGTFGGGIGGGGGNTINISITQQPGESSSELVDRLNDIYGSQLSRTASRSSRFGGR